MTINLSDIDRDTRDRISYLIHESVLAAPGTYEVPTLCKIVESKSIYNVRAIHCVIDDELEYGGLFLDSYNRLYSDRNRISTKPRPSDRSYPGPRTFTFDPLAV